MDQCIAPTDCPLFWCVSDDSVFSRSRSARPSVTCSTESAREMAAHTGGGEDPFRLLPDEILRHMLSFLPGEDALQTCVLDTRWRDLWRRATSLVFDFDDYGFNIERCRRLERIVNLMIHPMR